MIDSTTFADYLRRIRGGDEQAAAELVRRYEPFIRREVRSRLRDRRLRRAFDSMDVCQSVLASFFVRAAAGQYDLERPEHLLQLLVGMARNKVASQARQQYRQRRDPRRLAADGPEQLARAAAADPTPSQLVGGRELLAEVRRRLTEEERRLADLRGEGRAWEDIATQRGGTAQARRMQLARALDRVAGQPGLDEESHEWERKGVRNEWHFHSPRLCQLCSKDRSVLSDPACLSAGAVAAPARSCRSGRTTPPALVVRTAPCRRRTFHVTTTPGCWRTATR